jgi:hypothetical protein
MQLQAIELQQQAEESLRGLAESTLIERQACHDLSPHWNRGPRIRRNMTGSLIHRCHTSLTHKILQVLLRGHWHRLTRLCHGKEGTRETTSREHNNLLKFFSDLFSLFSSLNFSHSEGGGGMVGYCAGGCRLRRSYHTSFIAPQCNNGGGEAAGLRLLVRHALYVMGYDNCIQYGSHGCCAVCQSLGFERETQWSGQSCLVQLEQGTKRHKGWPTF